MMRITNKIYPWKIKEGACRYMVQILNYPETVDDRMDGQICRITDTGLTIESNVQHLYHKQLITDHLWQVKVLGIDDREFLVLQSLLIALNDDIVIVDKTGKLLF